MTRRTALALATSVALASAGATFAVGTMLGLFGAASSHTGPTGTLSPIADAPRESPRVETVYVDVTAPPEAPATGAPRRPAAPPATVPSQVPVETVFVDDPAPTPTVTAEHDDGEHDSAEPSEGHEGDD